MPTARCVRDARDRRQRAGDGPSPLAGRRPASRGLLLHGAGYSIAEAARRTGASRQQIYRRREQLRAEP